MTIILFAVGGFSAWVFMERGFSERRDQLLRSEKQRVQLTAEHEKLRIEARYSCQQMQEKLTEKQQHIESIEKERLIAGADQVRYQDQTRELRSSLQKQERKLAAQEERNEQERQRQTELEETVLAQNRMCDRLRKEIISISSRRSESDNNNQELEIKTRSLEKELAEWQNLSNASEFDLGSLRQKLAQKSADMDEEAKLVEVLRKQLKESKHQQSVLSKQKEEAQKSIAAAAREVEKDKKLIQELEKEIRKEKQSNGELESLMSYRSHGILNHFEENVIKTLESTQKVEKMSWRIISQMDVSRNSREVANVSSG